MVTAFVSGLVVQVLVVMNTADVAESMRNARQEKQLPDIVSVRVFAQYLLGDRPIEAMWDFRRLISLAAPLIVLGVFVALMRRVGSAERVLAATFVGLSVISFLVPLWRRGTDVVGLTQRGESGRVLPPHRGGVHQQQPFLSRSGHTARSGSPCSPLRGDRASGPTETRGRSPSSLMSYSSCSSAFESRTFAPFRRAGTSR